MAKKGDTVRRRVVYPCGYVCTARVSSEKSRGGSVDLCFSTRLCEDHKDDCVNPEGHRGHTRLGTHRHPHVDVECRGEIQPSMVDEMEPRLAFKRGKSKWPSIDRVDWIEEGAYLAVDSENESLGYVLLRGAPAQYIEDTDLPFVFMRTRE